MIFILFIVVYLVVINFIGAYLTIKDKTASKTGDWRVKENTLLLVATLGGSIGMYITMKKIHHKTHHKVFMIGIPIILIIELLIALFCILAVIK